MEVLTSYCSLLQVVSNDDSAFKEPYPPSSDCYTQGEGASIVGVIYSVCSHQPSDKT